MPMIKCPECGKDISDLASACPNCGFPMGFESPTVHSNQQNKQYQSQQTTTQYKIEEPDKKNSMLGILALVFSILGCTFWLGLIFAIIDLRRKDEKKKTYSIIAIGISILWIVIALLAPATNKDDVNNNRTENISKIEEEVATENEIEETLIVENEKEPKEVNQPQNAEILQTGTYIVGDDLDSGKYNFYASKGTGTLKIYKTYEDYKNDEYGYDAFRDFDMLANGASVGLLNEDVYTDVVYGIRLEEGYCIIIDKGLELEYCLSNPIEDNILNVGTYIVGEDIKAGKYDFAATKGSGSLKIYNSYDEYLKDLYGFDTFEDYDMKEENASVGMLNEDVYSQTIRNVRLEENQCLVVEKGLVLEYSVK